METKPNDWILNGDYASTGQFSKFNKNHPSEYKSIFANLDKIAGLLDSGNKIGAFNVGFFRSEGSGVYRIGQTGVAHAKESRLYVFPDSEAQIMYLLVIGDKDSQERDLSQANELVQKITKAQGK
jgi:putative component of toxin-antitoxin plasmid stabilization module